MIDVETNEDEIKIGFCDECGFDRGLCQCTKDKSQVNAGVSRWRDVKDELPPLDMEVLLWNSYWNNFTFGHRSKVPKPQVFGQSTDTERHKIGWSWGCRTGSLPYKSITHWIPLPEPPSC